MIFAVIAQEFLLLVLLVVTRNDIYLEIVKTVGITVSAIASLGAVYLASRTHRSAQRVENQVARRRVEVRSEDTPGDEPPRVVIEERHADGEADGK